MAAILKGAEPKAKAADLARQWNLMRSRQENFRTQWQLIADQLAPWKSNIIHEFEPGAKKTYRVFDSTGIRGPRLLAARMHGDMTSPAQKWFSLKMRQEEINRQQDVKVWLEENADRMYLAQNQSNWSTQAAEFYHDLATFGTGAMLMEAKPAPPQSRERFGGFRYRTLPIGSYCIDENADSKVDVLFRTFTMSRRAVLSRWTDRVDSGFKDKTESDPYQPVEILHAVYPREEGYKRRSAGPRGMPFVSCYVLMMAGDGQGGTTSSGERIVLDEGGFRQFPYAVTRWQTASGEVYGTGQGHEALPDIRTLNRMKELNLQAIALDIHPPILQRQESIIGRLDLAPGAPNIVDYDGGPVTDVVAPLTLNRARSYQDRVLTTEDLVRSIEESFFYSLLRLQEKPDMTLGEVQIRVEFMLRLLGPTFGRLKDEFLNPVIERNFQIMSFYGAMPPLPDALAQFGDAADIDIEYEGPLARAQRAHDLVAVERTNAWLISVLPFHQEAADLIDLDEQGRTVAEVAGMPANLIRDAKAVEKIRRARQEAQAQATMMQMVGAGAEALGKAGPGVKALAEAGQAGQGAP